MIPPINHLRRSLVATLALAPISLALNGRCTRASPAATVPDVADDQAYIQSLAATQGPADVPTRARPYRLHKPVVVAPGTRLAFAKGVHFLFDPGPVPIPPTAPIGVFRLGGDGIALVGATSVRIRSSRPDANLYAVFARGVHDTTIVNISAQDCAHVYVTGTTEAYAQSPAVGAVATGSARVSIIGGGAEFAAPPSGAGHAACVVSYCTDFVVQDCRYANVAHGIQWWGGDADPDKDGRLDNARKCGPGRIERIEVVGTQGASVWGSMGRDITVVDCKGRDAGDVGFDSEGGIGITFLRCEQTNAKAGCFAVFFENDNIRFIDCRGVQPRAEQPLFRSYGKGRGDSRAVTISGGRFSCTDGGIGTLDNAYGAIDELLIRGVTFDNVILRFDYRPFRRMVITGNRFRYDSKAPTSVIMVGASDRGERVGVQRPRLTFRNNKIFSRRAGPASELIRFSGGVPSLIDADIAVNQIILTP